MARGGAGRDTRRARFFSERALRHPQYLANQGRRRARAALAALRKVGARKTARMLQTAMAPHAPPTQLSALDDRFYAVPEDLALLGARCVGLREP